MFKSNPTYYSVCFLVLLMVSACGGLKSREAHDPFSAASFNSGVGGAAKPTLSLPVAGATSSDSSVEIFDMEIDPSYQRGAYQRGTGPSLAVSPVSREPLAQFDSSPSMWGGNQGGSTDSSVTIYDIGGGAPSVEVAEYQNHIPSYGQNYGSTVAGEIFFKHGSSRLGSGDMRKIKNLAETAKFAPVDYVTVAGYASKPTQAGRDTPQAHIINLRQSMKRSEKVSKALMNKGVPGEKIKTVSWGASKATGNDSQDRRVDVVMGEE